MQRGDPLDEGEVTLHYELDLSVTLRPSGGIQINAHHPANAPILARHPADPSLSLLGQSCEEAGRRLPFFVDGVERYSACKHYAPGVFLDVTLMCRDAVSLVTVVWEPLPPEDKAKPWPADHCN